MTRLKTSILPLAYFRRPALEVAPLLLGKYLVHETTEERIEAMITEVEAYVGPEDLACHASRGRTARTEAMFAAGGVWYVYFIYGMYWLLNIVTGDKDHPSAILVRGVSGVSGPGRVGKKFKINKSIYGKLANKTTGLWIEDRGVVIPKSKIKKSPRIGVDYAGPIWAKKRYRFYIV